MTTRKQKLEEIVTRIEKAQEGIIDLADDYEDHSKGMWHLSEVLDELRRADVEARATLQVEERGEGDDQGYGAVQNEFNEPRRK